MHFLLIDETNKEPEQGKFYILGGMIINLCDVENLCKEIIKIREELNFPFDKPLKFHSTSHPSEISHDCFLEIKKQVIHKCIELDVKFYAICVHKNIAKIAGADKQSKLAKPNNKVFQDQTMEFQLNLLLPKYLRVLDICNSKGFVFYDRDKKDDQKHYVNIFQNGVYDPITATRIPVQNKILSFARSNIHTFHAMSALDIALGTLGYIVNNLEKPLALSLLQEIKPLLLNQEHNTPSFDKGVNFYPTQPKVVEYQKDYSLLAYFFTQNGVQINSNFKIDNI